MKNIITIAALLVASLTATARPVAPPSTDPAGLTQWWAQLDENWQNALATTVGKEVSLIAPTDLNAIVAIRTLDLSHTGITTLEPVKRLVNLEVLHLDGTAVNDLAPVSELKSLREISLANTDVMTLLPLQGLTQLEKVNCNGTLVAGLESLNGLPKLVAVNAGNTYVSDFGPVRHVKEVQASESALN